MASTLPTTGAVWQRGDDGYEEVRNAAVWQHKKPDRYPDLIVRVADEHDVVEAVRYARDNGLKVKARGGGHSWSASSVRDGGLLIDFSDFHELDIDAEARTATVTPSVKGGELTNALAEHNLTFPSGHCAGVGLGGYLLQGGFGWNGRTLGMACANVRAIDVVTADGELIHADDTTNSEYLWAARGAGPGFFGVVTRFYLDVHPSPALIQFSTYVYPMAVFDDVVPWFLETAAASPRMVEAVLNGTHIPGVDEPVMIIVVAAYTDSEEEGRQALSAFEASPVIDRALDRRFASPTTLNELYDMQDAGSPQARYGVDTMWTREPARTLVPELRELFDTLPTTKSLITLVPWSDADVANAVFSMWAPLGISVLATYDDEADDERCMRWATDQMRRLEPFSVGIALADENLINRPAPYLAPENAERLEQLRAKYDPTGLFHSYLVKEA